MEFDALAARIPAFAVAHDTPPPAAFHKYKNISLSIGGTTPTTIDCNMIVGADHLPAAMAATRDYTHSSSWVVAGPVKSS